MRNGKSKSVAVIVAHPDDETLWAGGTILNHPSWHWFVACLCRGNDQDDLFANAVIYSYLRLLDKNEITNNIRNETSRFTITGEPMHHHVHEGLVVKHPCKPQDNLQSSFAD